MPRIPTGAVHDAEAAADRAVELAAPGAHVIIWAAEFPLMIGEFRHDILRGSRGKPAVTCTR